MPVTTRATRKRTMPTTTIQIIQLGIGEKKAVEKTSQALREGQPKLRLTTTNC